MSFLKIFIKGITTLILGHTLLQAQTPVSGSVSLASTYVWRGIVQNPGPAFQSSVAVDFNSFQLGLWTSSVDFGPGSARLETDPFLQFSAEWLAFNYAIGITGYSYDLFQSFNNRARMEGELYARVETGKWGLATYYVPPQKSTQGQERNDYYWIELSNQLTWDQFELLTVLAYGTYSNRFLDDAPKKGLGLLTVTVSKAIFESFYLSWVWHWGLSRNIENNMVVMVTLSF